MQPLGEGEEPPLVPEPFMRDEELELPVCQPARPPASQPRRMCHSSQPRKGGRVRGWGSGTRELLHQARGRDRRRGRAGVNEPMEVSEDTAESTDEEMEDGERLRASAFHDAKTQKFANFESWRTS
eukprot:1158263-Pelagomonas_calceolata.AAC.3